MDNGSSNFKDSIIVFREYEPIVGTDTDDGRHEPERKYRIVRT
jgi:hypothetical protein